MMRRMWARTRLEGFPDPILLGAHPGWRGHKLRALHQHWVLPNDYGGCRAAGLPRIPAEWPQHSPLHELHAQTASQVRQFSGPHSRAVDYTFSSHLGLIRCGILIVESEPAWHPTLPISSYAMELQWTHDRRPRAHCTQLPALFALSQQISHKWSRPTRYNSIVSPWV